VKKDIEKSSREIDRWNKETSSNIKILEERTKKLEEKNSAFEGYNKNIDERLNKIENYIKEIGTFLKATEEYMKSMDNRLAINENLNKDFGDRLEKISNEINRIYSKQLDLEKRIPLKENSIEEKTTILKPTEIYNDAYETFKQGAIEDSRKKFEEFIKKYPESELSENAQYFIAETYFLRKDFEKAIIEYEKIILKYPNSDKIPIILLKQGMAFLELGDKKNAKVLFKRIIEKFPRSDQAELAKKNLKGLE